MGLALIVVPDSRAASWHDRADGQEARHLTRLEDAALGVDQGVPSALELEPQGEVLRGELVAQLCPPPDLEEGGLSHSLIDIVRRHSGVHYRSHVIDTARPALSGNRQDRKRR
jgi:hypothetical protein